MATSVVDDYDAIRKAMKQIEDERKGAPCAGCSGIGWSCSFTLGGAYYIECSSCHNPEKKPKPESDYNYGYC